MKRISTLLTHNDLELSCVILSEKSLFPTGKEVIAYAQNRLFKGYIEDDDDSLVAELDVIVEFCIIPELEELIKESEEMYRVITSNYKVIPFERLYEAFSFKKENGGTIYQKIGSYGGGN